LSFEHFQTEWRENKPFVRFLRVSLPARTSHGWCLFFFLPSTIFLSLRALPLYPLTTSTSIGHFVLPWRRMSSAKVAMRFLPPSLLSSWCWLQETKGVADGSSKREGKGGGRVRVDEGAVAASPPSFVSVRCLLSLSFPPSLFLSLYPSTPTYLPVLYSPRNPVRQAGRRMDGSLHLLHQQCSTGRLMEGNLGTQVRVQ